MPRATFEISKGAGVGKELKNHGADRVGSYPPLLMEFPSLLFIQRPCVLAGRIK